MKHWIAAVVLAAAMPAYAEQAMASQAQPLTLGHVHVVASKPMAEDRVVNVVLPASYGKESGKRYPVLYLIDGGVEQDLLHVAGTLHLGSVWGRSAEAIVVGIETKDRRKELAGPTKDADLLKRFPTAGSSASFRAFIRDEVKPLVDREYRTNGHDAVIGESLAGLFIVETYLVEPALFDAYAAIDPSLWWDKESLSVSVPTKIGPAQNDLPIYLAMAKEQAQTPAAMERVVDAVKGAASRWCLATRPELLHSTIYQQLTPQALQFLLPPAVAPAPEFGFSVQCSAESSRAG